MEIINILKYFYINKYMYFKCIMLFLKNVEICGKNLFIKKFY